MRKSLCLLTSLACTLSAAPALAKGLDDLAGKSPEEAGDDDSDKAAAPEDGKDAGKDTSAAEGEGEGTGGETASVEATKTPSAASKAIATKLFVQTSFGWVHASKSKGSWKGSGMSDLTVGYKVATFSPKAGLAATYRYAPVAVSGTQDDQSYRGVWETHYLGARFQYAVSPSITAIGTGEAGYVVVHMNSVDGLPPDKKINQSGASVALGGGADFAMADKGAFTLGPRVTAGFGSFTTVQVAAAAGFLF